MSDRCACGHDRTQHDGSTGTGDCVPCACPAFHSTPRMVETVVNDRWPILLPSHRAYRREWNDGRGWEPERLDSMSRNIRAGDVVFDVGAEEGDFAGLCAQWAGKTGGVVLVEPNPRVWPNIRAIWEANELRAPLGWWVGFAAQDTDEHPPNLDIDQTPRNGWPQSSFGPLIGDHGFRVLAQEADATPRITLDDLAARFHAWPDVITMDIEGAEHDALSGAAWILKHSKPLVYVSLHPPVLAEWYGRTVDDVHDLMRSHGYIGKLLATDHEEHWLYHTPEGRQVL